MKNLLSSIFIFIFAYNVSLAFEIPAACLKKTDNDCVSCSGKDSPRPSEFSNKLSSYFALYAFVDEHMSKIDRTNIALKNSLAPIFRTLRDGEKEPSYKTANPEISAIREDFNRLTILSRESVRLERKFNICMNNCSAYRKLQLRDEIEKIQKLKIMLFVKRPILADKVFEEKMMKLPDSIVENDDAFFKLEDFKNVLKNAVFNNLQAILKRDERIAIFNAEINSTALGSDAIVTSKFSNYIISKFPSFVEEMIHNSVVDSKNNKKVDLVSTCSLAENLKYYLKIEERKNIGLNVAAIALPLLAGPFAPEAAVASRGLLTWGLSMRGVVSATAAVAQAALLGKNLVELNDLQKECSDKELQFLNSASVNSLDEFNNCHEQFAEKKFLTEVSILASGLSGLSTVTLKFLSRSNLPYAAIGKSASNSKEIVSYIQKKGLTELKPGQVSVEFSTKNNGVFSIMDLSKISQTNNQVIKDLPEKYWRYVGDLYNERLNLSKVEIDNFIKSSVELSPRTKLILNTDFSPMGAGSSIKGGIGLVNSKNAAELLPLEKATGIKIIRKPNENIVEIVRLAVGKNNTNAELTNELVDQAVNLINQDKSVSRLFIFTSKVHARLYKRMGVIGNFKDIDKRDVLIEINRKEMDLFLKHRKELIETANANSPIWTSRPFPRFLEC